MRAYRNTLLSAVALALLAPVAHAGDVTPPSLAAQSTVQDTDLLMTWRNPGPLKKLNASVFAAYIQSKYASTWLQPGNNLSDLASVTSARTNLGLGTAALVNTGTSGGTLCLLNTSCTFTSSVTFTAGLGSNTTIDVTTPNNGTTGGLKLRANGTSGHAYFQITDSTAAAQWGVLDFTNGAMGYGGTLTVSGGIIGNLIGNVTGDVTGSSGSTTGNAATASKWQTARNLSLTGDVTGSASIDGSGNVSLATTAATVNGGPGSCGDATHVCQVTTNGKGLVTAQSTVAITASPIKAWANFSGSTASVTKSLNVTGVTHGSTGHYGIIFTSTLADASYAVSLSIGGTSGSSNNVVCAVDPLSKSTGGFSIYCQAANSTMGTSFNDPPEVYASVLD